MKKLFITSTPMARMEHAADSTFAFENGEHPILKIPQDSSKRKTVLDMVLEAVEAVGVKRKGATYPAIKKYISDTHEDSDMPRNIYIKRAVNKAVEKGLLSRPLSSKAVGAVGSFILVKPKVTNKSKEVKSNPSKKPTKPTMRREQVSDSEATVKKPPKPKKLNMSDTAINDLEANEQRAKIVKPKSKIVKPKAMPEKPKAMPEKPKAMPEKPKAMPEKPKAMPEKPKAMPEKPKAMIEKPKAMIEKPKAMPEKPKAMPEKPKAMPEKPKAKPENSKDKPEKPNTKPAKPEKPNTKPAKPEKPNTKPTKVTTAKNPKEVETDNSKPKRGKVKNIAENERKDASDSEVIVKKPNRKSLKSYSSDTEVDTVRKDETLKIKAKQTVPKAAETKTIIKNKTIQEISPKAIKRKKLFKPTDHLPENDGTTLRAGRSRVKAEI